MTAERTTADGGSGIFRITSFAEFHQTVAACGARGLAKPAAIQTTAVSKRGAITILPGFNFAIAANRNIFNDGRGHIASFFKASGRTILIAAIGVERGGGRNI